MSNTIKFKKNKQVLLNNRLYKPYFIGHLPSTFGFIYDEESDKDGISEWFNHKGLTYIPA